MSTKKKYHPDSNTVNVVNSRTQQERCYSVTKKMLHHLGLEPEMIDVFTKKQRLDLLTVWFEAPIVKPKKEKTVPRHYVRNIHANMHTFMKTKFWGNIENQLTYMDAAIYGMSFLLNLSNMYEQGRLIPDSIQEQTAKQIYEKRSKESVLDDIFENVLYEVWFCTRCFSKVNFRMYGYEFKLENSKRANGLCLKVTVLLTAQDSESKKFTHNGISRRAFRVLHTADGRYENKSFIRRNLIFADAKENETLNIYIQSHVLHRLKERLDTYGPALHNLTVLYAFTNGVQIVSAGRQKLFSCLTSDAVPIGYFTFFVQGSDIVINTFLPLLSPDTPEGKKFHELLPLSNDDMNYLGMDKTSFLLTIDFEQIPVLKQALVEAGVWATKLKLDSLSNDGIDDITKTSIDMNRTIFVKKFFEKLSTETVL
ncbi:MAG: hypothetical protein LBV41_07645 [Cytophagaceae bacterium]|jgi:hypothetical protein|nr:hypothetical protein [Cytophagaceae bacterium]